MATTANTSTFETIPFSQYSSMADHNLLFLHHKESPSAVLASQPLFGGNYTNWAWSI